MKEDNKKKIMKLFRELHKLRLEDIRNEETSYYHAIAEKEKELVLLLDANPCDIAPYFRWERDQFNVPTDEFIRVFEYSRGLYHCITVCNHPNHLACKMDTVGLTPLCKKYHPITQKVFMDAYNKVTDAIRSRVVQGHEEEEKQEQTNGI